MIEIRIRHELEAKGAHLCDVSLLDIDKVIPLLTSWGLQGQDTDELSAGFVYDSAEREAYFEIVIADDDPTTT